MLKKIIILTTSLLVASSLTFAGGKGGTEIALANYGGLGVVASRGIPLNIKFLSANGIRTFGEVELGAGFGDELALGAELSGGLLIALAQGISIYGSLGPAIGVGNDASFGLGAEVGFNIDINESSVILEVGRHPASSYVGVGLRF